MGISLQPPSATLAVGHRVTFAVQATGLANTAVNWSVSGIAGGSTALGQICVVSSNPCAPATTSSASQVDYLAPAFAKPPGPAQFDGTYQIEKLPVGRSYQVYAEPLNGAVDPSQVSNAIATLCRNATTDSGWPSTMGCVVPPVSTRSPCARSLVRK